MLLLLIAVAGSVVLALLATFALKDEGARNWFIHNLRWVNRSIVVIVTLTVASGVAEGLGAKLYDAVTPDSSDHEAFPYRPSTTTSLTSTTTASSIPTSSTLPVPGRDVAELDRDLFALQVSGIEGQSRINGLATDLTEIEARLNLLVDAIDIEDPDARLGYVVLQRDIRALRADLRDAEEERSHEETRMWNVIFYILGAVVIAILAAFVASTMSRLQPSSKSG